jgi:hypothetical protein
MSGYAFMTAVGDAITRACGELEPDAFHYRGADLRYAAERALFVRLANNAGLAAALSGGGTPSMDSPLEAAVARHLLGTDVSSQRLPSRARTAAGKLRRPAPLELPDLRGGTWFLVDHAKFLRFIAPVTDAAAASFGVLSLAPPATELLPGAGLPFVAIDYGQDARPPSLRAQGEALRSLPGLAVEFDRFARLIEALRPARLVVIEGNAPTDELLNRAAQQADVPCVCLQQGWSPVVHTGFRNMSYADMAVWGEGFAEILRPHNPAQQFTVTGSHMLERPPAGAALAAELGGAPAVGFFLQPTSMVMGREHVESIHALALRVATELPDTAVVVREHPAAPLDAGDRETLTRHPNVVLAPGDRYGLRSVLDALAVTVSIYSTTLVESAALGTPPVVVGITGPDRYSPDLEALGAGIEVRDTDAAFEAIRRLLTNAEERERLEIGLAAVRNDYFAGLDGGALERVVAVAAGT